MKLWELDVRQVLAVALVVRLVRSLRLDLDVLSANASAAWVAALALTCAPHLVEKVVLVDLEVGVGK